MAKKKGVSKSWKNWLLGILVVLAVVAVVFSLVNDRARLEPGDCPEDDPNCISEERESGEEPCPPVDYEYLCTTTSWFNRHATSLTSESGETVADGYIEAPSEEGTTNAGILYYGVHDGCASPPACNPDSRPMTACSTPDPSFTPPGPAYFGIRPIAIPVSSGAFDIVSVSYYCGQEPEPSGSENPSMEDSSDESLE